MDKKYYVIGTGVIVLILIVFVSVLFESDVRIPKSANKLGSGYYKTSSEVYFESGGGLFLQINEPYKVIKINGADTETFVLLGEQYAKDKNYGYWKGKPFGADVVSLSFLYGHYIKDKNNVYFQGNKLEGVNAEKFKVISFDGYGYAKDDKNIWFGESMLSDADIDTFEVISPSYTKDKNHVWYFGKIIQDADPSTFEVIDNSNGKDKYYYYKEGKRVSP